MVHKWLLKRVRNKLLTGLVLIFIIGLPFFVYVTSPLTENWIDHEIGKLEAIAETHKARIPDETLVTYHISLPRIVGGAIGVFGMPFIIVGILGLVATVTLEHMKKKRYANRSKI